MNTLKIVNKKTKEVFNVTYPNQRAYQSAKIVMQNMSRTRTKINVPCDINSGKTEKSINPSDWLVK